MAKGPISFTPSGMDALNNLNSLDLSGLQNMDFSGLQNMDVNALQNPVTAPEETPVASDPVASDPLPAVDPVAPAPTYTSENVDLNNPFIRSEYGGVPAPTQDQYVDNLAGYDAAMADWQTGYDAHETEQDRLQAEYDAAVAGIDGAYTDPRQNSPLAFQQLNQMLAQGSPLMEYADTKGKQKANQAGLLNSSLAGQASQLAIMDSIEPYALQDADFSAGLLSDRQKQGWDIENIQLTHDLLMEANAPKFLIDINNSEMPSATKQFLIDTIFPDGLPGVEYGGDGGDGSPVMPSQEELDAELYGDPTALKERFNGSYSSFLSDAPARKEWRTQSNVKKTPENVISFGKKMTKAGMGGSWNNTEWDMSRGVFDQFEVLERQAEVKKLIDRYGTYDNMKRALDMWLGPDFSGKERVQVALAGA